MKDRKFKKCLITGITGSGGSYLAEHILSRDKNIKIFGIYRSHGYKHLFNKNKRVHLFKGDLRNQIRTQKIIKKIQPDLIFHLASSANVRKSFDTPYTFINNNIDITINLLESIRRLKVKPLTIICSTSEVYGLVSKKEIPIKEKQIMRPASPYAVSKSTQDLLSQVYHKNYGQNIIITRMFSYTNARRKDLFATSFANQISLIEKGIIKILRHGNLESVRTFVDISDAMEAYWLTAKKGKIGEIYNIGGKKTIKVKDFLHELIKNSNVKIRTQLDKKLLRPTDVTLQIPDCKKFQKDTGWKLKISFKNSVKKLLVDCRKN
tara:strand:- start:1560 stop:2522 length:963 start_codon:yes stop_codon:yes gene_type:complete